MKNLPLTARSITIFIIAIVLILVVGFALKQYIMQPHLDTSTAERIETDRQNILDSTIPIKAAVGETEEQGTITGRLTYPSEGIPPSMAAHAFNLDTHKVYSTNEHIALGTYRYGYELHVPAGTYYVYGTKATDFSSGAEYAFYDKFMTCYSGPNCEEDYTKVKITVEPGKETKDITVGNWWMLGCNYMDGEATVGWLLLPNCDAYQ